MNYHFFALTLGIEYAPFYAAISSLALRFKDLSYMGCLITCNFHKHTHEFRYKLSKGLDKYISILVISGLFILLYCNLRVGAV